MKILIIAIIAFSIAFLAGGYAAAQTTTVSPTQATTTVTPTPSTTVPNSAPRTGFGG